jgi:hypothetical protein
MVVVSNHIFHSERKAHFAKKMQNFSVKEGQRKRDEETRRMEEYRRLCKKEGIQSKRLEEYDKAKERNSEALQKALDEVDHADMTNAQKRRRKYALKRKAASQPSALKKLNVQGNPLSKMERVIQQREEAFKKKQQARADREKEKAEAIQRRNEAKRLHRMKTKKGQPVMSTRIESLLKKIQ